MYSILHEIKKTVGKVSQTSSNYVELLKIPVNTEYDVNSYEF